MQMLENEYRLASLRFEGDQLVLWYSSTAFPLTWLMYESRHEQDTMNNDIVKVEERHLTNDESDRRRTLCVTKRKPALRPPFGLSKPSQRHDPHHHFDKSHGRLDVSSRKRHSEPLRKHWPQDEKSHPVGLSQPTLGVERSLSGEAEDEDGNNDQTCLEIEVLPPSPIALLGPGEGDPFFVLPSDLPRKFIDERLYSGTFRNALLLVPTVLVLEFEQLEAS